MHLRSFIRAALLTGCLVGTAQAATNHSALVSWKPRAWTPPVALRPSSIAPASAGMRVERDPVDGTLSMPQPDRFENMVTIGERTPVSVMRMGNGRVRAQLDESFADFAVVRIGPDGKPHWTCVNGTDGAARFMQSNQVPVTEPKREDK